MQKLTQDEQLIEKLAKSGVISPAKPTTKKKTKKKKEKIDPQTQRKQWVERLTAAGVKASLKESTDRLRKKIWALNKAEQKQLDKTPNKFAMTKNQRNRKRRT